MISYLIYKIYYNKKTTTTYVYYNSYMYIIIVTDTYILFKDIINVLINVIKSDYYKILWLNTNHSITSRNLTFNSNIICFLLNKI